MLLLVYAWPFYLGVLFFTTYYKFWKYLLCLIIILVVEFEEIHLDIYQ